MSPPRLSRFVSGLLLLAMSATFAVAQTPTLTLFQTMAVECLAPVPDTLRTFGLATPAVPPYLRTALLERWHAEGRAVYLADSTQATPASSALPRLLAATEQVRVVYARVGRRTLRRTATLHLRYTLTAPDGRVLDDGRCERVAADTLARRDKSRVENPVFPETQAPLPEQGWLRRTLEPAVLAATVVLTAYLLFTLRSNRTDA